MDSAVQKLMAGQAQSAKAPFRFVSLQSGNVVQLSRRHRIFTLALAVIAAGTFFVFITGVLPLGEPKGPLRSCELSDMYKDPSTEKLLPFATTRNLYHYAMEQLVEERMRLYEGRTHLHCFEEEMESIIPPGEFASVVAERLAHVPSPPDFTYDDFDLLLYEFWRTYDCHLLATQNIPSATFHSFEKEGTVPLFSALESFASESVGFERERAAQTYDRLLTVLRSSEQHLPLHASLRCLQRASTDVRNAFGIIADSSQCLPASIAEPTTSLLP